MRSLAVLVLLGVAARVAADEPPPVDPDAPAVTVLAKRDGQVVVSPRVKVGEPFHVVLTAVGKPGVVVNLPASFDLGSFEVVERKELPQPAGAAERTFDLTVVGWEPGTQSMPPIPVTYVSNGQIKQMTSGALAVEVVAVVHEEKDPLRPIAGPVSVLERNRNVVIGAIAVVSAALLFAGYLWLERRLRRRKGRPSAAAAVVDTRSPDVIALEKLGKLVLPTGDARLFYFELSEILREFLGRRFGFDALELTTSELLAALRKAPGAEVILGDLEGWLLAGDLVKYAGVQASRSEAQTALDAARGFVERARPILMPSEGAPAPAEASRA